MGGDSIEFLITLIEGIQEAPTHFANIFTMQIKLLELCDNTVSALMTESDSVNFHSFINALLIGRGFQIFSEGRFAPSRILLMLIPRDSLAGVGGGEL